MFRDVLLLQLFCWTGVRTWEHQTHKYWIYFIRENEVHGCATEPLLLGYAETRYGGFRINVIRFMRECETKKLASPNIEPNGE